MYKKCEHIHFMGIGGIGMSGIAEVLRLRGYTVSGCDLGTNTKTLDHLKSIGCMIQKDHDPLHVQDADVLVYSAAVRKDNPEILAALARGIPVIPRAIMLAELMRTKYSVAVSGAHGKTTTTSLISHIMVEAGKNPTVVVGGVIKNIANNAQLGDGELLIAEACESDRSLLYLNPTMAIVTNIDAEHLDTYKDLDDIKATFKDFLSRLPFYGKAFVCNDDANVRSILPLSHICTVKYGFDDESDIMACNVTLDIASSHFDVFVSKDIDHMGTKQKSFLGRITLNIAGRHMVLNALAAIAVSREFGVPFSIIAQSLETFRGVERRFEFKGSYKGAEIVDDYGHHPTEIKQTLLVARRRAQKNLHVVFQPHRYSRTQKLWKEFVDLFARHNLDSYTMKTLCITEIYPASEDPIDGITAERLVAAIKNQCPDLTVLYFPTYEDIITYMQPKLAEGDLLLTVGAGKINKVGDAIIQSV